MPPIKNPDLIITIYDRFLLSKKGGMEVLNEALHEWVHGFGSSDSPDTYWYNNAKAAGSQLYPTGLAKYYDLHSTQGMIDWAYGWIWAKIQGLCLFFTFLIPIDVWIALFNGVKIGGLWKIITFYQPFVILTLGFPTLIANYFKIEMADGWGILKN